MSSSRGPPQEAMPNHNKIDKITNIKDLDALFEDFKQDRTQLCPTEERIRRYFLSTPPLAITIAKEENGEIIITTKIPKQS